MGVLKGTGSFSQDATPFSKGKQKLFKGALGLGKKKADTSAQDAMLEQQRVQQAMLDDEENRKRKRFLSLAEGIRAFRGSPLFRATGAQNSAASAANGAASAAASGEASPGLVGVRGPKAALFTQ